VVDESFDEFVRAYISTLDRYAYALTGDRHRADDLVQETLVRLAGAWRRVRRDVDPGAYARTVMFRTHISLWRRWSTRPEATALTTDPPAVRDPYAAVDARLTLRVAVRRLSRLQRAVLVATYLDDSPDDEIAALIGRSASTVRSLRHRALKALRADLGIPGLAADETKGGSNGSEFSVA
jgi:RNA polymerase sigma-70 factor (sigma-E family)